MLRSDLQFEVKVDNNDDWNLALLMYNVVWFSETSLSGTFTIDQRFTGGGAEGQYMTGTKANIDKSKLGNVFKITYKKVFAGTNTVEIDTISKNNTNIEDVKVYTRAALLDKKALNEQVNEMKRKAGPTEQLELEIKKQSKCRSIIYDNNNNDTKTCSLEAKSQTIIMSKQPGSVNMSKFKIEIPVEHMKQNKR